MSKKINIAVIGCSGMSKVHILGILDNPKCHLYSLCDIIPERLEDFAAKYPADRAVTDYKELLGDKNIDAVVIVTPDKCHREMTNAFLRDGKAVLCEKPLALTMEECEDMIRTERETNGKLMVGQICRCTPGFIKAKELVDAGKIGELIFVESEYAHNYSDARGAADWRVDPDRHIVIGGGCHAVDLLRWIAGNPIEVYAYHNHKGLVDWPVEDTAISVLKFPNDVIGKVFVSSGIKRDYTMRSVFYGTKGTIICDNTSDHLTLFTELEDDVHYTTPISIPVAVNNHNAAAEIDAFVNALNENAPMPITSVEGASTVAVCRAIVESAKTGVPVQIVYPQ